MKKLLSIFFIFFSYVAFAQQPALLSLQGIGGNNDDDGVATYVTTTQDSGFIINFSTVSDFGTGNIDSFCTMSGYRTIFAKYNGDASVLEWSKCYGQAGDSFFSYIFPANDGGVVLGGEFNSTVPGYGFLILKEDPLGNIIWKHSYSRGTGTGPTDMIATSDGGYMMIGVAYYTDTNFTVHNSGSLNGDIAIIKLDSIGNKVWGRAIGGSLDEFASKVIEISGSYYIVGYTTSNDYDCTGNHGQNDVYVVRLDNNGNIIWHNDLGGTGEEKGNSVIPNSNGGLVILGATNSTDGDVTHPTAYGGGYWLINLDSSNHIVWNNCYGNNAVSPHSICRGVDNSIWMIGNSGYASGEIDAAYGDDDAWILHTDSGGNFINAKVLGSTLQDEGYMIYPLSNGNVITGGVYSDSNGSFSSVNYYGALDNFLAIFSPFTTQVSQLSITENDVSIFPNPANEVVTIDVSGQSIYTLEIYDATGSAIYKATAVTGNKQIAINEWQRGVYCVKLTASNGNVQVKKLVVL